LTDEGRAAQRSPTADAMPHAMRQIHAYLVRQLLKAVTFTTLTVVLVGCSLYSQRYLGDLIEHGISPSVFLDLVVFMMPTLMVVVLPVTLFASITFIYGKMIGDNELTVLRASGVAHRTLLMPALMVAVAATALSYAMSLYFIPRSYSQFKDVQALVKDAEIELLLREQTFNSFVPGLTIYFRERLADGRLADVLIYDSRDPRRTTTVVAERAVLRQTQDSLAVGFEDGNLHRYERPNGELSIVHFETYGIDFDTTELLRGPSDRQRSISELSIGELLSPPLDTAEQQDLAPRKWAEGHQRLTAPLLCLTVTMLGGATMFAGQQRRAGHRLRLFAVGVGIAVLLICYQIAVAAAAQQPMLLPLLYGIVLLPALLGAGVLAYIDRFAPGHGFAARLAPRRLAPRRLARS
jgi:lipopolysaccharide export system permease protein